ncbi:hypothetical protein, partial [Salmonella enterica]|uniref:hypothetical protein n=1 Tax=Salmonella enterica TaxID=28901 RepID=UPI0020A5B952
TAKKTSLHRGYASNLPYPKVTARAGARAQRHLPDSIRTLRLRLIAALIQRLPRCPCCGSRLNL